MDRPFLLSYLNMLSNSISCDKLIATVPAITVGKPLQLFCWDNRLIN
jgi:hypothetical protein